jgi:chromosomal replication initiator protein
MATTTSTSGHDAIRHDGSDSHGALWQSCLERLEKLLPRPTFEMCLRGSRATCPAPGRLRVTLSHGYAYDMLRSRQRLSVLEAARKAVEEVAGEGWEVEWAAPTREEEEAQGAAPEPVAAAPGGAPRPPRPALSPSSSRRPDTTRDQGTRFTFDRLITGPSNQMAVQAARQAADAPGRTFNPLVVYGDVGLGKTHLMLALKHMLRTQRPNCRIVYTSSEAFTNELVDAFQERRVPAFRKKYRHVDLLMIDDVEFLIGKDRIQEEFYHTFEELAASGRQVILTCDRPPRLLTHLQDRLCSRLSSGLIADIQAPTLEMRRQILLQRLRESAVSVGDGVVDFIAESFAGSVRNLEGALVRTLAVADATGEKVTLPLAQRALHGLAPSRPGRPRLLTLTDILEKVSHYYHVDVTDLIGVRRDRRFSTPRHIAMYLANELARMRCREISEAFGNRDYSTVTHAIKKIAAQREQPNIKNDLRQLEELLG